jgi:hypothetical protein
VEPEEEDKVEGRKVDVDRATEGVGGITLGKGRKTIRKYKKDKMQRK